MQPSDNTLSILFCSQIPIDINKDIKGGGNWITGHINALKAGYKNQINIGIACIDFKVKDLQVEAGETSIYRIPVFKNSKLNILAFNYGIYNPYDQIPQYISAIIKDFRPDIIQIFGYESPFIRIIGTVDQPVVVHFQGYRPAIQYKTRGTRTFTLALAKLITNPFNFLSAPPIIDLGALVSYDRRARHDLVKYVFGRTEWDRNITRVVSPSAQYFYCQEVIRADFKESITVRKQINKVKLVWVGKNNPNKNLDLLLDATQIAIKAKLDLTININLIGIDKDLDKIITFKRDNPDIVVTAHGRLTAVQISEIMLQSDIFVFSSAIENSPNALQEAMLSGLPVITTAAGGVLSIVEHRKTGYIVPEGDPYCFAGGLIELIDDYALRKKIGQNARAEILARSSPKVVADTAFSAYQAIYYENQDHS